MTLAYLILGHAAPAQMIRAIERLRPSAAVFVVHIDARAGQDVYGAMEAYALQHGDVLLTPRHRCYWGGSGLVEAELACIRTLLASGRTFDYAVLLSGQDYPIKTSEQISTFFEAHAGEELIEAFPLRQPNRWTAQRGRFQALARVLHWTFSLRSRTFHLAMKRRFYAGWEPFGGSQWWALSAAALRWIDSYLREHPALARYFRFVFIPDETMLQTMLGNSPFAAKISSVPVHYIDWERPNPKYPRTLDDEDFVRLAAAPELFARKLHPGQSAALLERIDGELL